MFVNIPFGLVSVPSSNLANLPLYEQLLFDIVGIKNLQYFATLLV